MIFDKHIRIWRFLLQMTVFDWEGSQYREEGGSIRPIFRIDWYSVKSARGITLTLPIIMINVAFNYA